MGLVEQVERAGIVSKVEYPTPNKIESTEVERNVKTTTDLDEWLRPKSVVTTGPDLTLKGELTYDANGRVKTSKRWQDGRWVTETFGYDALGRLKTSKSDGIAVGASASAEVESKVDYDLGARTIKRTLPGGAEIVETLDGLGRVRTRRTVTGSSDIVEELAYDLAGNLVYTSDNHLAAATAYDVHGRATASLHPDGTRTETEYDAMGNPTLVQSRDAGGALLSESRPTFTPSGRLQSMATKVDAAQTRTSTLKWDGGGRTTYAATQERASQLRFDDAGRLKTSVAGRLDATTIIPFNSFAALSHESTLVKSGQVTEKGIAAAIPTSQSYDTMANVTRQNVGGLEWKQTFDEDSNLTSSLQPERPPSAEFQYRSDARGNLTEEIKPGAASFKREYAESGAATAYDDPVDPPTTTVNDRIGRPRERTYADGTSESFTYDGPRLLEMKDRQERIFRYEYNANGQLFRIRNTTDLIEEMEYQPSGDLAKWRTRDAELAYDDYDLEGRPRRTKQTRYADHSGFGAKTVLDQYTQEHEWNVHGERKAWTMPS
ncbi:MAG: hypothetical protein ABI779_26740, partial [Acidobacteriota bacterium]